MFAERILILIPHPDDEVVGCAAACLRARAEGCTVHGLYLTTGLAARAVMWPWQRAEHPVRVARRRAEAERVAAQLGIKPEVFLDIPSRGLKDRLDRAAEAVRRAVERVDPGVLWVPAWEGGHSDHDAANALAASLGLDIPVVEFAEYNYAGGAVHSQAFPVDTGTETVLTLTPEEVAAKRAALSAYRSERGNLGYVESARECFRPLAEYDYGRPPHGGPLFYQRFQWVPFRHPRVDFTKPDEVAAAVSAFRKGL